MRTYQLIVFAWLAGMAAHAAFAEKIYRWVDQNGKVHYSQTKPDTATTSERSLVTDPAPTPQAAPALEPEPERNQRGECLTVKCMADEMEADRLKRERGYAEQRAKNERALQKKSETSAPKTPSVPLSEHDKQLQHNCKRGLYYGSNSKINCDDMDAVRKEWKNHYEREMAQRDYQRRHGYSGR